MAYCKRCACGFLNVYEHAGGGPMRCQRDNRPLRNVTETVYTGQPEFIDPHAPAAEPQPEPAPVPEPAPEAAPETAPATETEQAEAAVPTAAPRLRHVLVADNGRRYPIGEGQTIVGRLGLAADYLLGYPDVSRKHCEIRPSASGVFAVLEDTSKYGTYVNGVRMEPRSRMPISNGTVLRFAGRAGFTYVIEEETES